MYSPNLMCFEFYLKFSRLVKKIVFEKKSASFLNISKSFSDIRIKLLYFRIIDSLLYIKPQHDAFNILKKYIKPYSKNYASLF